jgi:hypothetical protein
MIVQSSADNTLRPLTRPRLAFADSPARFREAKFLMERDAMFRHLSLSLSLPRSLAQS